MRHRAHRPERRRQDDAVQRHLRAAAADAGSRAHRRRRRHEARAVQAGPARAGPHVPAARAVRAPHRPRERPARRRRARGATDPDAGAPTSCSSGSASPSWPTSRADRLPTGQARLVELAPGAGHRPEVLLLDEPASGQDEQRDRRVRRGAAGGRRRRGGGRARRARRPARDGRVHADPRARLRPGPRHRHAGEVQRGRGGARRLPRGADADERPLLSAPRACAPATAPIEVLHGVDLDVPAGSVVAVLGPNGAGKTTLLSRHRRAAPGHRRAASCWPAAG